MLKISRFIEGEKFELQNEKFLIQTFVANFGYNFLSSPHIFLNDQEKNLDYYKKYT